MTQFDEHLPPLSTDAPEPTGLVMPLADIARPEGLPDADLDSFGPPKSLGARINQGTLMMIVLLLVAGGGIYAMRVTRSDVSKNDASAAIEAKIEQALAKLTKPEALRDDDPLLRRNIRQLFQDTDAVVSMFSVDNIEQQVPIEFVKKNPFKLHTQAKATTALAGDSDSLQAQREREKLVRNLKREFSTLTIQSIMIGRVPLAMINNEICRVGDTVGSFKVVAIRTEGLAVDLSAYGMAFQLKLEDSKDNQTGLRRSLFQDGD